MWRIGTLHMQGLLASYHDGEHVKGITLERNAYSSRVEYLIFPEDFETWTKPKGKKIPSETRDEMIQKLYDAAQERGVTIHLSPA